jgi:hypothetical protein
MALSLWRPGDSGEAITVDCGAEQPGQRGGFIVGQVKVHGPDMGSRPAGTKAGAGYR